MEVYEIEPGARVEIEIQYWQDERIYAAALIVGSNGVGQCEQHIFAGVAETVNAAAMIAEDMYYQQFS